MSVADLGTRQVDAWLPFVERAAVDVSVDELRHAAARLTVDSLAQSGSSMLVVTGLDVARAMSSIMLADGSRTGVLDPHHGPDGVDDYTPIPEVVLPPGRVYALIDFERGDEFRGMPPRDALREILRRGRTPLTIDEGIAVIVQHPDALARNHCFSLAGSRRGDKRVPALWISRNAPKLGWCWEGNPHDWLGCASAAERLA